MYVLTYAYQGGMIAIMTELHPIAVELAKIEADYARAVARLAAIKATRRDRRGELKAAMIEAISTNPNATHVELALPFGVTEGHIRHLRRNLSESVIQNG